jgi:hypothetical protein
MITQNIFIHFYILHLREHFSLQNRLNTRSLHRIRIQAIIYGVVQFLHKTEFFLKVTVFFAE